MKKQKNNKWLYIIITILCILVLLLGGYIVYDKVLERDSETNNNYNSWNDYIMNTNINSIKLNYCVEDSSNDIGIPTKKTIAITKYDLKKIFTEMEKGTISKNYYGGLGGPCMSSINIDYTNDNNEQYELNLILYKIINPEFTKDDVILFYLENANYEIKKYSEDMNLDTEPYMFEYSYNEEIINTIIDEYVK